MCKRRLLLRVMMMKMSRSGRQLVAVVGAIWEVEVRRFLGRGRLIPSQPRERALGRLMPATVKRSWLISLDLVKSQTIKITLSC